MSDDTRRICDLSADELAEALIARSGKTDKDEWHAVVMRLGTTYCGCPKCRAKQQQRKRQLYRENLEERRKIARDYDASLGPRNREKTEHDKATQVITLALRKGKLVRPSTCEECGADPGLSAGGYSLIFCHIPDPTDPWTHEWLCSLCAGLRRKKYE